MSVNKENEMCYFMRVKLSHEARQGNTDAYCHNYVQAPKKTIANQVEGKDLFFRLYKNKLL